MKKTFLALITLSCMTLCADIETNAYMYLDDSNEQETIAYIFYNGHFYFAPKIEHYMKCPCQYD